MPLSAKQERQLRAILRRLAAANAISSVPGGAGKALEAWVFSILADAARNVPGWLVSLHQSDGSPLPPGSTFLFSGGPSGIPSVAGKSCFVRLHRPTGVHRTLELHNGVQHLGRSDARHEWDVALLPHEVTQAIRAGNQSYPRGLPILGIECKDKSKSGNTDEMRQTLARMYDLAHVSQNRGLLTSRIMSQDFIVGAGKRWPVYKKNYENGLFGILRAGGFQRGARDLSDYYHVERFGHVTTNTLPTRQKLQSAMKRVLASIDTYYP